MSYLIYSLPRSRSTWLSHFLYTKEVPCYHDKGVEMGSMQDLKDFLSKDIGIADTALILHWKKIQEECPNTKTVVIMRDLDEVIEEMQDLGLPIPPHLINSLVEALVSYTGPKVSFSSLATAEGMSTLCSLIGQPFDEIKYEEFKDTLIQPLITPMINRGKKNQDSWLSFFKEYI